MCKFNWMLLVLLALSVYAADKKEVVSDNDKSPVNKWQN